MNRKNSDIRSIIDAWIPAIKDAIETAVISYRGDRTIAEETAHVAAILRQTHLYKTGVANQLAGIGIYAAIINKPETIEEDT